MKLISQSPSDFQNQKFVIELTGHEIVTIMDLASAHEGGEKYANGGSGDRITYKIHKLFPDVDFYPLRAKLMRGKVQ